MNENESRINKQVPIVYTQDPEGCEIPPHLDTSPVCATFRASFYSHKFRPILGEKIEGEKESVQPSRRLLLSEENALYGTQMCS